MVFYPNPFSVIFFPSGVQTCSYYTIGHTGREQDIVAKMAGTLRITPCWSN